MSPDVSITRRIVHLCYILEDSSTYRRSKRFVYDLVENPRSRMRPYFDLAMIGLVLLTVFLIVFEVHHPLGFYALLIEYAAIAIFLLEYLLRAWIYNDTHKIIIEEYEKAELLNSRFRMSTALWAAICKKWEYMTQPLAVIDLLAILPSYRPLRMLRIFLLFRVFKLFRYTRSVNEFAKVLAEKRFELSTLAIFIGFVVFASATAIYIFEARDPRSEVNTFFDAIYWSLVTISTVGYGDITPQTDVGRFITLILIVSGIGVIAFSTSIMVSAFSEKLSELRERRVLGEVETSQDLVIVCGYGRVGEVVADKLPKDASSTLVIIDQCAERVEHARKQGYLAICADATRAGLLQEVGVRERASTVLCITGDDVTNAYITLMARHLDSDVRIIARANRTESVKRLRLAGASEVVAPYQVVGIVAAEFIAQPVASQALHGILRGEHGIALDTIVIPRNTSLEGRRIADVDFAQHRLILFGVMSVSDREGSPAGHGFRLGSGRFFFNPPPDFVLQKEDFLVVLGRGLSIAHFRDRVNKSVIMGRL